MENKLTAVGWLVNKLMKESTGYISLDALTSYTEQALEMEKEQILEACGVGFNDGQAYMDGKAKFRSIEHYYNETYGK